MQLFFGLAYFVVGFVQIAAIAAGVEYGTGFGGFISMAIALFTTYIPVVGSILGVYGAYHAWDWGLIQALVLFFWYVPVGLVFVLFSAVAPRFSR